MNDTEYILIQVDANAEGTFSFDIGGRAKVVGRNLNPDGLTEEQVSQLKRAVDQACETGAWTTQQGDVHLAFPATFGPEPKWKRDGSWREVEPGETYESQTDGRPKFNLGAGSPGRRWILTRTN